MASSSGAGPSSRHINPLPIKRNFVTQAKPFVPPVVIIDSDSEPEVILIDDSSSDIEIMGTRNSGSSSSPSISRHAVANQTGRVLSKPDIIDLSMDEFEIIPSLLEVINQRTNDGYYSDNDSVPEGFEPWEPTVPLRITRSFPPPKLEEVDPPEPELAWHPPKMSWFREDCTSARSAGAFIEPVIHRYGRPTRIEMVEPDPSFFNNRISNRHRSVREKMKFGLPTERMIRNESSILYADPMIPIPGMNAPRGAVNCISQTRGYIAIGRTYEESAAYDGGGLALWSVKDQKAQDIPAHITHAPVLRTRGNFEALPPEKIQNSILAVGFDPADNTKLLSAGQDNMIQLWNINEGDGTVDLIQSHRLSKPGCMAFCPQGSLAAMGHAYGVRVFNVAKSLNLSSRWDFKQKGNETVSISWGAGRSQHKLVAGTQQEELVTGRLVFMDVISAKPLCFANSEACSTLSFDPTGNITAFTGSGRGGKPRKHVLRLYDVSRTGWRPTAQIGIPSSKTNTNGEVIEALWSPNGIHLACARDDNSVNVFDVRWLGQKQCMLVFKHDTESHFNEGENLELYGVQGISWFGSEKLVSGGADQSVRMWDVKRDDECRVLATLGGAVGYLLGSEDPELFPIIAGDLLGNVHYLPNRLLVPRS